MNGHSSACLTENIVINWPPYYNLKIFKSIEMSKYTIFPFRVQ